MKIQQQHNGVVVMEERGSPAGLRQAPRKRRSMRGRAAPRGRSSRVLGCSKTSNIYRGGRGLRPHLGFPPQGVRPALDGAWGGGQEGERGEARLGWALGPICPRVCPLPHFPAPWALWGGAH